MGDIERQPSEGELEQQARAKIEGFDPEHMREYIAQIKTMSVEQLRKLQIEQQYADYELAKEFNCYAINTMRKIDKAEDPKGQYGRSALPGALAVIARHIDNGKLYAIEWAKLEWAKELEAKKGQSSVDDDLNSGILIDIKVSKTGDNAGSGPTQTEG